MSTNGTYRAVTSALVILPIALTSFTVQAGDLDRLRKAATGTVSGGVHIVQQAAKDTGNGVEAIGNGLKQVHVQSGVSGGAGSGEQMNPDAQPNPNSPSGSQSAAAVLPVLLPLQIIVPAKDLPRAQTPATGPTIENLDAGTKPYPREVGCGGMNCLGPADQPIGDAPDPKEIVLPARIPIGGPARIEAD